MRLEKEKSKKIKVALVGTSLLALTLLTATFGGCASCSRLAKSWESEMSNGIYRIVYIYDVHGELISTYAGYFDLTYDENRIIFDDENGKRHQIFLGTGTVIVDEVEKEDIENMQTNGEVKVFTR